MEDYKEKYEQALQRAKQFNEKPYLEDSKGIVEYIFPELAESEDERIRKDIVFYIAANHKDDGEKARWLYWLEKQGEQKPADKVEPKFHKGDWVVCNNGPHHIFQVIERSWPNAKYRNIRGAEIFLNVNTLEKQYHLWTIKDAKDGDVLHCWIDGDEFVLIYKGIKDGYITTYGHLYQKLESFSEEPTTMFCRTIQGHFTPATKEQHDLLFKKMKEAGYEWDAEKKELKKIEDEEYNGEDYGIDSLYHAQRILEKTLGKVDGYQSDDGILEHKCAISAVKKLYEQKPANKVIEEEKPLLEKFKQAVYDCAWGKVTCKVEGESQEEYANRWAEHLLILVRDWADDYIYNKEDAIARRAYDKW